MRTVEPVEREKTLVLTEPLWGKILFPIAYLLVLSSVFVTGWTKFLESVAITRYPFRWVVVLLFVVGGVYILLRIILTRTIFDENGIVHRNFLAKTIYRNYGDITDVIRTRSAGLTIKFKDEKNLNLDIGENRLPATAEFLSEKIGRTI